MIPGAFPNERATFVAPTFRLPCSRMSRPVLRQTTSERNAIEPIRYEAATRRSGSMRRAFYGLDETRIDYRLRIEQQVMDGRRRRATGWDAPSSSPPRP